MKTRALARKTGTLTDTTSAALSNPTTPPPINSVLRTMLVSDGPRRRSAPPGAGVHVSPASAAQAVREERSSGSDPPGTGGTGGTGNPGGRQGRRCRRAVRVPAEEQDAHDDSSDGEPDAAVSVADPQVAGEDGAAIDDQRDRQPLPVPTLADPPFADRRVWPSSGSRIHAAGYSKRPAPPSSASATKAIRKMTGSMSVLAQAAGHAGENAFAAAARPAGDGGGARGAGGVSFSVVGMSLMMGGRAAAANRGSP